MRLTIAALTTLLALGAAPCRAQHTGHHPTGPAAERAARDTTLLGQVPGIMYDNGPALGPPVGAVLGVLHRMPYLNPPLGWDAEVNSRVTPTWGEEPQRRLRDQVDVADTLPIARGFIFVGGVAFGVTRGRVSRAWDFAALNIQVNVVPIGNVVAGDAQGLMFTVPLGTVAGFPALVDAREPGEATALLTKRPGPVYVPVSQERLLRWAIARERRVEKEGPGALSGDDLRRHMDARDSALAQQEQSEVEPVMQMLAKTDPEGARAMRAALDSARLEANATRADGRRRAEQIEARLARMSPAERAAPAHVLPQGADPLDPLSMMAAADAPDARPLLAVNPRLLDPSRPRDVQLLAVRLQWPPGSASYRFRNEIAAQLDWAGLLAIVR